MLCCLSGLVLSRGLDGRSVAAALQVGCVPNALQACGSRTLSLLSCASHMLIKCKHARLFMCVYRCTCACVSACTSACAPSGTSKYCNYAVPRSATWPIPVVPPLAQSDCAMRGVFILNGCNGRLHTRLRGIRSDLWSSREACRRSTKRVTIE